MEVQVYQLSLKSKKYTKKQRKIARKSVYKVYKTYYTSGEFYIGLTSKTGIHYDNYFGSNTTDRTPTHKEILFHSHHKSDAKLMELMFQLQNFYNDKCLNKMLNIRLRRDFIKNIPKFKLEINVKKTNINN